MCFLQSFLTSFFCEPKPNSVLTREFCHPFPVLDKCFFPSGGRNNEKEISKNGCRVDPYVITGSSPRGGGTAYCAVKNRTIRGDPPSSAQAERACTDEGGDEAPQNFFFAGLAAAARPPDISGKKTPENFHQNLCV